MVVTGTGVRVEANLGTSWPTATVLKPAVNWLLSYPDDGGFAGSHR